MRIGWFNRPLAVAVAGVVVVSGATSIAQAAMVNGEIVLQVGQTLPGANGGTIASIQQATYDGNGVVGVMGLYTGTPANKPFYYYGGAITYSSINSTVPAITPNSVTNDVSGVGNAGQYAIQVAIDGTNGIYSGNGGGTTVVKSGDTVASSTLSSIQRPQADASGNVYFYSTLTSTPATRGIFRAAYSSGAYTYTKLLGAGDTVSGAGSNTVVTNTGISNTYDVSSDGSVFVDQAGLSTSTTGSAVLSVVKGSTASTTRTAVSYIGGNIGGASDQWFGLDGSAINNSGTVVTIGRATTIVSGTNRTDTLTVDNTSALREGNVVDGVTLVSAKTASINDSNQVLSFWDVTVGANTVEALLLGNTSDLSASKVLLKVTDTIDTSGDGLSDYTITDILENVSGAQNLQLPNAGDLYVRLSLAPIGGGSAVTALVAVPEPTTAMAAIGLAGVAVLRRRRRA